MHAGWQKKKSITGSISNSEIDRLYEKARAAGAIGGKLLGAGGGGFLLLYCEPEKQQSVMQAMGLPQLYCHVSAYGSRIVYFNG